MTKNVTSETLRRSEEFQAQLLDHFSAAVVEFGITADQLFNAGPDQMRAAARAAAWSFVRQEPPILSVPTLELTATVDYGLTLEQHVRNGCASAYARQHLTGHNFLRLPGLTGVVTNEYAILGPYRRNVTNDEILAMATRLGLHRPTPEETLVVGRAHPGLILVGFVEKQWLHPCGDRYVPVVVAGGAYLFWRGDGWGGGCSFLFRK
jgi:hypothetical protein